MKCVGYSYALFSQSLLDRYYSAAVQFIWLLPGMKNLIFQMLKQEQVVAKSSWLSANQYRSAP